MTSLPAFPVEDQLLEEQRKALLALQEKDGHFCFELEADCTIPAEYVLLKHFVGTPDVEREPSIATYLKRRQNDDGSWPLFYSGAGDISCSVKAYWALSLIGEDVESAFMVKARQFILAKGGAARANVFTRITLALFGEIPWRGVPTMPVELMLLPRWFPFHMSKVSYWSRTVIAPLLVLAALKPKAVNPTGRTVRELFVTPPEEERVYNTNPTGSFVGGVFLQLDKVLRVVDRRAPQGLRQKAIDRAMAFIRARLNGDDGLGAIYPAMANVCMAYHALGVPEDDPERMMADGAIHRLITVRGDETYLQPCFSPVWDTVLAAHALMDTNTERERVKAALDWLCEKEILTTRGDWIVRRPDAPTGGWAFQYQNDHYPDVDDTAVIVAALHRFDPERYRPSIARGADWLLAMQSRSGGWGAFEPENEHFYLNSIPFADHGALLDPPTVDVTARCVSALAQLDDPRYHEAVQKGVAFILREQEVDGSWFGRWGANYVYGTWSALCGLNAAGVEPNRPEVQKAVAWLKAAQRDDGGWGEGLETYEAGRRGYALSSTPSQTAWAVLGLMAAGAVDDEATSRGIAHLRATPTEGARFQEEYYTGTGFPRVFYLKYHGYSAYFPLWALGRYEGLMRSNARQVAWGL